MIRQNEPQLWKKTPQKLEDWQKTVKFVARNKTHKETMEIGDKIPETLGFNQDGDEPKAADYRGRKPVLYAYPKVHAEHMLRL